MQAKPTPKLTAPPEVYRQRRAKLAEGLRRPMVVMAGHAPARNYASNPYPFRPGSTYLYYGGPPIEGAAWVIDALSDGDEGCALLLPPHGPDASLWTGTAPDAARVAHAAGIGESHVIDIQRFGSRQSDRAACWIGPPCVKSMAWTTEHRLKPADPDELPAVIQQRLVKDEHELAAMRRAAEVSMAAHRATLAATRPGRREAEVAAAFAAVLLMHEHRRSFTPIVTVRGEILHGVGYGNLLADGNLLLVDAGSEEPGGYACDITRTYPVNKLWSPVQRQIYDTVLRAQLAAVAACIPGRRFREIHDLAAEVICGGLVEADLLRGEPAELASRRAHVLFFPHGLGHLIGLDVHDMEDFGDLAGYAPGRERRQGFGDCNLRMDRDLLPDMTLTIEPGIYFVPAVWEREELVAPLADVVNRPAVDALLRAGFGGIRIEDTIRVRSSGGPENLSGDLPVEPDALAALIGAAV